MRKIVLNSSFVFLLLLTGSFGRKTPSSLNPSEDVKFGVKIGILPTGTVTQCAIFYYRNNRLLGQQPVREEDLIKIGRGKWPIPRTNIFHDFFEENNFYRDTLENGEVIPIDAAFDSLWKVRFGEHPLYENMGKGWSQGEFRPSLKQQEYIYNRYGVRGYDQDYFSDSSFYKLLKDVTDPDWIAHYKSLY